MLARVRAGAAGGIRAGHLHPRTYAQAWWSRNWEMIDLENLIHLGSCGCCYGCLAGWISTQASSSIACRSNAQLLEDFEHVSGASSVAVEIAKVAAELVRACCCGYLRIR